MLKTNRLVWIGLVVLALGSAGSFAAAPQKGTPNIVGGTAVSDTSQVPFIVQLHDDNGVECGGTVIAPQWVLSAGHCQEVVDGVTILGGTLTSGSGTQLAIKNHFVHPQYKASDTGGPSYDFMLIQLADPIDFTKSAIQPIALPDADFVSRGLQNPGQIMTVAGWGDLQEGAGDYPTALNEVQVPVIDDAVANGPQDYNGLLDSTMIAAGLTDGGKDSCDGDSGGPMFVYDTVKKQNVLVGDVSWGQGCAEANKPGIYGKVSVAYDWIIQTMKQNAE